MINKKINPNLIKLAEMTHNFDLALPDFEMLEKQTAQPDKTTTLFLDKENFVYVPSINLYVAKERKLLGKNWFESHQELQKNSERMLIIPEFVEFLKYAKTNHPEIYNEITEVRNPWRAEWLDADFKVKDKKLYINYNHVLDSNGNLIYKNSEVLDKATLMEDKTPGISLEDYLTNNNTKQGLPSKNVKSGDFYYWFPGDDNNSVARFDVDSCRAYIFCDRNSSDKTKAVVEEFSKKHANVRYVLSRPRTSTQRNTGIKNAKGSVIVFFDDDSVADHNYLNTGLEFLEQHPEIGIAGGPQVDSPHDRFFARAAGTAMSSFFGSFTMSSRYKKTKLDLDAGEFNLTSANVFIRKEILDKIGGFDESLCALEDIEFGVRLANKGHRIMLDKTIQNTHDHPFGLKKFFYNVSGFFSVMPDKTPRSH